MPDDNRFAGLSEAVEDDPDAESDDGDASTAGREDESEPALDAETDSSESGSDPVEDGSDSSSDSTATESDDPAAFPFDATEKKTVYVRPETLAELDDARALVDAQLRTDHDVRDLTGREFYDAVFRLAAADTEGLIDEVLEAREE